MRRETMDRKRLPALLCMMAAAFALCFWAGNADAAYAEDETVEPFALNVTEMQLDKYGVDSYKIKERSGYINDVVSNENPEVATVKEVSYEDYYAVIPKSPGTTVVTFEGEDGNYETQQASVTIMVTDSYIEGYKAKYRALLKTAVPDEVEPGDTWADFCFKTDGFGDDADELTGTLTLNGVTYEGEEGFTDLGNYKMMHFIEIPALKKNNVLECVFRCGPCEYATSYTVKAANLPAKIKDGEAIVKLTSAVVYNGKKQTPAVTLRGDWGDITLKKGTDYKVAYSANKLVGKAKVVITGIGNYTGSYTKYFKILPKGTSLSKLTAGKKKLTVKWKKQSTQTTGYQIRYSLKSSMKSAKTVTIKSNKTTSKVIKSLKAKKKYYVQVRTYKTVKSVKYYSSWSKKQSLKTK